MFRATLEEFPDGFSHELEHALDLTVMFMTGARENASALGQATRFVASTGVALRMLEEPITSDVSTDWMRSALAQVGGSIGAPSAAPSDAWTAVAATAAEFARAGSADRELPDPRGIHGFGLAVCQQAARLAAEAVDAHRPPGPAWTKQDEAYIARALLYGYALAIGREYVPDA